MQSLFRLVSLVLFLSPVLSSPVLTPRATTSGSFNVLVYNVAGLPGQCALEQFCDRRLTIYCRDSVFG